MKALLAKYDIDTKQGVLYGILVFVPMGIPTIIIIEVTKRIIKKYRKS